MGCTGGVLCTGCTILKSGVLTSWCTSRGQEVRSDAPPNVAASWLSRSRVWAEPCLLSCAVKKLEGSVERWLSVAEQLFGLYLWGR